MWYAIGVIPFSFRFAWFAIGVFLLNILNAPFVNQIFINDFSLATKKIVIKI